MVPVIISPLAGDDAEQLGRYLLSESLDAALRFADAFEKTITLLSEHPRIGHVRDDLASTALGRDARSISIVGFPNHLIFYRVEREQVRVLRILHGSRDLPAAIGEQSPQ